MFAFNNAFSRLFIYFCVFFYLQNFMLSVVPRYFNTPNYQYNLLNPIELDKVLCLLMVFMCFTWQVVCTTYFTTFASIAYAYLHK